MGAARSNLNRVRKEAPKDLKWAEDVRDAPAPRWWTVAQQQNHVFRGKELRLGQQALEDSDVELLVDFTLPQLPKLRELKLDGNNLSDSGVVLLFERGIHRCPKLRRLYLDNNAHVTDKVNRSVAEVLLARPHGALDYVSGVDLRAAAHILRIPQHLARLDKENDPGIGKQREANYEILRFLREREKDGGGVHAAVAKVLVTGPEGAGKTSLVHHLLWDGDFLGKQARPTHGLEVTDWHTTSQELRFYDFSGQQVYAHTRRLWLATNGVFVLVWRPTRNMNAAAQLVDYVRDVVNDAPEAQLLLVSTHADEAGTAPLSPKALKAAVSALPPRAAERVAGYFHVSSKTGQGMKELRCRIEELARGLPYMSEEPPAAYERLRSRIEEMAKTDGTFLLTNSEWQELAAECGVEGHRDALNFLHNCGTLMKLSSQQCPGNSQEAAGLVVIQPKKLDEVLRRVIASTPTARSHVRNGVLRHRDLEQVWPSSLCPPRLHSAMLRFLHAAELGFPIVTEEYGDHHETLLPSMLDGESESISESAAQLYDDLRSRYSSLEENGTVDVTLSTMPRHFGAQLHVQLRPFAVDFGWSANGCVLALKNEDQEVAGCARAVFRYGAKTVRIESFGSISLRHEILSGVVRLLENSFKGIVVKNMTVSYTDGELVADQWSLTELRRLARAGEDSILCDACEIEKELVLTDVLWFLAKVSEKVDYTPMLAHAQSAMRPSSTSDLFDEDGPDVEASPTISAAFSETLDQFMERGVTNDFDVAFFLQQLVAPTDQQILRTCALRCFNWLRGPHANSRRLCMEAIWLLYRRAVGHDTQYVAYPLRPRFMGRWTLSPEDAVPISSGSASLLPADGSDQEEAQQVQSIFERMVTIMEIPEDRHRDVFEGVIFSREPLTAEELHAMAKASASYCWAPSAKIHVHPYDLPEFTNENAMMSFPSVRPNFDAASQQADSIFAVHRALGSMEQILESLQGSDDQPEEEIGELPHGRDLGDALRDTAHTLALIEEQREMLEGIFSGSLCGNDVALLSKAEDIQESLYAWRRVMRRRLLLVTTSIAEVEGSYGGLVPDDQAPVKSQQQQQQQLMAMGSHFLALGKQMSQLLPRKGAVPFTPLVLPLEMAKRIQKLFDGKSVAQREWYSIASWMRAYQPRLLVDKFQLFFVCPVSGRIARTNGGKGFKLKVLKENFQAFAPFMQFLIGLIKISIAAVGGAASPTGFGSFETRLLCDETIGNEVMYDFETLASLSHILIGADMLDELSDYDEIPELDLNTWTMELSVRDAEAIRIAKPCVVAPDEWQKFMNWIRIALDEAVHMTRYGGATKLHGTGLVPVLPRYGGSVAWVHPSAAELYRDEGEACLCVEAKRRLGFAA